MSYHVEVVVKRTGKRIRMTSEPCSRKEAETFRSKLTVYGYGWRRIEIVSA